MSTEYYPGHYALRIYNSAGEHIKTLDEGTLIGPFAQHFTWDGTNVNGDSCADGVYIIYWADAFDSRFARVLLVH